MGECMNFPKTPLEFLRLYEFKDEEEIYTNGSMLIPTFRVKQMIEHYFNFTPTADVQEVRHGKWIKIEGEFFSSTDGRSGNVVKCSMCGAKMDKE